MQQPILLFIFFFRTADSRVPLWGVGVGDAAGDHLGAGDVPARRTSGFQQKGQEQDRNRKR